MPITTVVISTAAFRQAVRHFSEHPGVAVSAFAGVSRMADVEELLIGRLAEAPVSHDGLTERVILEGTPWPDTFTRLGRETSADRPCRLALVFGVGDAAGMVGCEAPGTAPIDFRIAGPPLTRLQLRRHGFVESQPPLVQEASSEAVWARTIDALGESVWRRLVGLRYLIVGVGRSGSVVFEELNRLGCRHIGLVDGDSIELHNLGEMTGVSSGNVGQMKVLALRDRALSNALHPLELRCVSCPVQHPEAVIALKQSDVIFSCLDNDEARYAVSFLASLFLKPLIDVGTGILDEGGLRQVGADVRLILPGERCLHCLGGLPGLDAGPDEGAFGAARRGSLHALNALAVRHAVLLLQDVAGGLCLESTWLRLEASPANEPSIRRIAPPPNPRCPICELAGAGDRSLHRLKEIRGKLNA